MKVEIGDVATAAAKELVQANGQPQRQLQMTNQGADAIPYVINLNY